jgi:hypothetical protein
MVLIGNWPSGTGGNAYEGSYEEWVQVTDDISLSFHLLNYNLFGKAPPPNKALPTITESRANRFRVGGRTWDLWEWDPETNKSSAESDLLIVRAYMEASRVGGLLSGRPASPHAVSFEFDELPLDWRGWVKDMVEIKKAPRRALRAYDKLATHKPPQEAAETVLRNVEPGFDRLWPGHPIGGTRMP